MVCGCCGRQDNIVKGITTLGNNSSIHIDDVSGCEGTFICGEHTFKGDGRDGLLWNAKPVSQGRPIKEILIVNGEIKKLTYLFENH